MGRAVSEKPRPKGRQYGSGRGGTAGRGTGRGAGRAGQPPAGEDGTGQQEQGRGRGRGRPRGRPRGSGRGNGKAQPPRLNREAAAKKRMSYLSIILRSRAQADDPIQHKQKLFDLGMLTKKAKPPRAGNMTEAEKKKRREETKARKVEKLQGIIKLWNAPDRSSIAYTAPVGGGLRRPLPSLQPPMESQGPRGHQSSQDEPAAAPSTEADAATMTGDALAHGEDETVDMDDLAIQMLGLLDKDDHDDESGPNSGELDDYIFDDDGGEDLDDLQRPDDRGEVTQREEVANALKDALEDLMGELDSDADTQLHSLLKDMLSSVNFPITEKQDVVPGEKPLEADEEDDTESTIEDFYKDVMPTKFHLTVSLFVSNSRISRSLYEGFVCVFNPVLPPHYQLPLSLKGLHSWRKYLPKSMIVGTTVKVDTSARQSKGPTQENPNDTLYTTKATKLVKALAANPKMQEAMYFGMQILVEDDKIREIYHNPVWGQSMTVTSGEFAFYPDPRFAKIPVAPGDVVRYRLILTPEEPEIHLGMVCQVCKDYRYGRNGVKTVKILRIERFGDIPQLLKDPRYAVGLSKFFKDRDHVSEFVKQWTKLEMTPGLGPFNADDLTLWEDECEELYVPVSDIVSGPMTPIFTDGMKFDDLSEEEKHSMKDPLGRPAWRERVLIPLIVNTFRVVTLKRSGNREPLRAEVEIAARGWENIILVFVEQVNGRVICIPLLSFADGFGLWTMGNGVYRSMMAIYLCLACLPLHYRMSIKHQYALAIGPMGVKFATILAVLQDELEKLQNGIEVMYKGEKRLLIASNIALLGDMLQQNTNAGIRGPKATVCCRSCMASKNDRGNINFNTCEKARTLWNQLRLRKHIDETEEALQPAAFAVAGFTAAPSLWQCIQKDLDPFKQTPHEPCHILGSCLSGLYQGILVNEILRAPGKRAYGSMMQVIDTPWSAMQHAVRHYKSFSYNQAIQAAQLNPLAIRMSVKPGDVSKRATTILATRFRSKLIENPLWNIVDLIAWIYSRFAVFLSLVFAKKRFPGYLRLLDDTALETMETFQLLADCFGMKGNKHKQVRKADKRGKKKKQTTDEDDDSDDEDEVGVETGVPDAMDVDGDESREGEEDGDDDEDEVMYDDEMGGMEDNLADMHTSLEHKTLSDRVKERPNVHALLHISQSIYYYGLAHNIVCSPGEQRHGPIREDARRTNHRNVDKQILVRDEDMLRCRLLIEGGYESSHPILTELLREVYAESPHLFTKTLGPIESPSLEANPQAALDKIVTFRMFRKFKERMRDLAKFPGILDGRNVIFTQIIELWTNTRTGITTGLPFNPAHIEKMPAQYFRSCTITRAYQDRPNRKQTYNVGKVYKLRYTGGEHYAVPLTFIRTSHDFHYSRPYYCGVVMPVRERQSTDERGHTDRVLKDVRIFDPFPAESIVIDLSLFEDIDESPFFVRYTPLDKPAPKPHPYALVPCTIETLDGSMAGCDRRNKLERSRGKMRDRTRGRSGSRGKQEGQNEREKWYRKKHLWGIWITG
ncbi:hypothetical protein BJ508DRAFT_303666 [Ascobolus immersus RN42]|uniref:Uncharacterized protein n=1 Tax=Ascobolus immersus RN42 TaxID=1160509 RepID=A0A3N4IKA4_ASCIM|nr:hypothetical protein BJ508DRAFT_303666 [Ascobolus immersus RN42]